MTARVRFEFARQLAARGSDVATGFLTGLGDDRPARSRVYRSAMDPARVVLECLEAFDRDAMTAVPGLFYQLFAQGHRLMPHRTMACLAQRMLAPVS